MFITVLFSIVATDKVHSIAQKEQRWHRATGGKELQHDTFERSLRTMSEKIVTLNEEEIKGKARNWYEIA